jgi:dTDP-4-amino-4,6-dideoxygalactose transaminase
MEQTVIPIAKPIISDLEKKAVLEVLESGMLAQGPKVASLEERFADLCGVKHAVATTSGTTALHVALLANGIEPGDEVITTPFTFIASVNSILFVGARPVLVDIDQETFNIDVNKIEAAITPKTKAIMPVHLYGQVCQMDEILALSEKYNLRVIEDSCQAVGATYRGKTAGSFGTGAFSLYATKNVMSGEGGMITTNDDQVAELCRMIRNHGMKRRYYHDMLGFNFRMSDLHAAIGLAQMERLDEFTQKRRENAAFLSENINSVVVPKVSDECEHVWHQYTIRVTNGRDRDLAIKQLNDAGIGTGIFYPIPAHKQDYLRQIVGEVQLPVSEQCSKEVISLPVHPLVSPVDLETIVTAVNAL